MGAAFCRAILAGVASLALAAISSASVVTFDMTVNDSATPTGIQVGDIVTVKIYGQVTANGTFGLAGYYTDVVSQTSALKPVQGLNLSNLPDGQWDVNFATPPGWNGARGNVTGEEVLGHGGFVIPAAVTGATQGFGLTRALLSAGRFVAVAPGLATLGFDPPYAANVLFNNNGSYGARPADVVFVGATIPIVISAIPEPISLASLAMGGIFLMTRRGARPD